MSINLTKLISYKTKLISLPIRFVQLNKTWESLSSNNKIFNCSFKISTKHQINFGIRKKHPGLHLSKISPIYHQSKSMMTIKWRIKIDKTSLNSKKISNKNSILHWITTYSHHRILINLIHFWTINILTWFTTEQSSTLIPSPEDLPILKRKSKSITEKQIKKGLIPKRNLLF